MWRGLRPSLSRCDFVLLSSVNGFGLEPFLDEAVVSGFSWDEASELSDLEGKEGAGLGSDSTWDASELETKESAFERALIQERAEW